MENSFEIGSHVLGFTFLDIVGHGADGDVFLVHNEKDNKIYALKVEQNSSKLPVLEHEYNIMCEIKSPYFPKAQLFTNLDNIKFIVMEALGCSLRRVIGDFKLRAEHAYVIATEMLNSIKGLHNQHYVHNDIKPENFLLRNDVNNPLVLIDFGIAYTYRNPETENRYPQFKVRLAYGTLRYKSPNGHRKIRLCPRDDMYSWFYCVLELFGGILPWKGEKNPLIVLDKKISATSDSLCLGLPKNLKKIYEMIQKYDFDSDIDYDTIQNYLDNMKLSFKFMDKKKIWKGIIEANKNKATLIQTNGTEEADNF